MSRKHPLKKYRTTFIMAVLATVMGAGAWYEYNRAQQQEIQQRLAAMILGWENEEEYLSARLERGAETIEVRRKDGVWWVTSPVEDLGNEFNIEAWFGDLATEKGQKIDAKKGADGQPLWAEYGLDKNLKTLTVTKTDGTMAVIQFAEHSAYDGSYFLKYNNEVWIGEKPWVSVLNKELKHLRERDIYRHEADPVAVSFDYSKGGVDDFSVRKSDDGKWLFDGPWKEHAVSEEDVKTWFGALRKISVVDFFDHLEEKTMNADYRQHQPLAKMKLVLAEGVEEIWTFSKNKRNEDRERYYIRLNDSSTLFEADKAFVERVLGSRDYFRDGRPETAVELEKVVAFQFSDAGNKNIRFEKSDSGQWQLKSEVKAHTFDTAQLETWLTKFSELEAMVFLNKSELKGIKSPAMKLEFEMKDSDQPLVFLFGDTFSSDKTFARLNPLVYTYVQGRGAFAVQKSALDELALDKLLKKEEIKQSSNESE